MVSFPQCDSLVFIGLTRVGGVSLFRPGGELRGSSRVDGALKLLY